MYINDENKLLSQLNALYWFKDSFVDREDEIAFLNLFKDLVENLEYEGLKQSIKDYLLIIKENDR